MATLRDGVIGTGYLGRFHAQKYADIKDVELVGIADTDAVQGKRVAKECGCTFYSDYRQLLPEVDALSIVVPTPFHFEVALDCLKSGKDILLEKPMTVTLEEADALIDEAVKNDLVLQVGHLERFNPAVQAMEPFLTTPVFIESNRIATFKHRGADV